MSSRRAHTASAGSAPAIDESDGSSETQDDTDGEYQDDQNRSFEHEADHGMEDEMDENIDEEPADASIHRIATRINYRSTAARSPSTPIQKSTYVVNMTRITAGIGCEADSAYASSRCKNFIRTFELSPYDAALLPQPADIQELPEDSTDRFYVALDKLGRGGRLALILLDFKSFAWLAKHRQSKDEYDRKYLEAEIGLSQQQYDDCYALIITGLADPDWVAFVTKPYFRDLPEREEGHMSKRGMLYSTIDSSIASLNPLPQTFAHLVMRRMDLPKMLDQIVEKSLNPEKRLFNPFTGYEYERQLQPELRPISAIIPQDTGEIRIRRKLWHVFGTTEGHGIKMNNPTHAPLTCDVRLDHESGVHVFVEIKHRVVRVMNLVNGQQRFSHVQDAFYARGVFTFKARFDWLLTMINDAEGYLLCKDDVPGPLWHQMPDDEGFVHHIFPDRSFLDARRISLEGTDADVAAKICQILKGRDSTIDVAPRKATLTATDIYRIAGPCPAILFQRRLQDYVAGRTPDVIEFIDDEIGEDEDEITDGQVPNSVRSRQAAVEAGAHRQEDEEEQTVRTAAFATTTSGARKRQTGGRGIHRDAQFILLLMQQCRKKGSGCVLDLGRNHPMGSIGFIRYEWTDLDKEVYDNKGLPPQWAGKLGNAVPMITLHIQFARWRHANAPLEGTPGEFTDYREAHPCIVVCTAFDRELTHLQSQRWIVPSEFMPEAHVGEAREPKGGRKAELFLRDKLDIERLLVNDADLHDTLLKFLCGQDRTTIGYGNVEVQTKAYLKTVGDYKKISDRKFNVCVSGKFA